MKRSVFILGIALVTAIVGVLLADLPTPVPAVIRAPGTDQRVAQVGVASPWTTLVSNAGSVDNSGSPITTLAQIEAVHPTSVRYEVEGKGTHLEVRLKYESSLTAITDPSVEVLAVDSAGNLSKLRNLRGTETGALQTNAGNVTAGIYDYTTPHDSAIFALDGAQHVVVGIQGALVGTGTVSTSAIEGRVISAPVAAPEVANARGVTLTTITKATWTPLAAIGNGHHRYLQILLSDDTASETAVVHVWGSPDGGTTWFPLVRADTLADAKDVTLAVGTYRPAAAGNYSASVVVAVGPATYIYLTEKTAPAAGTYSYLVGGL